MPWCDETVIRGRRLRSPSGQAQFGLLVFVFEPWCDPSVLTSLSAMSHYKAQQVNILAWECCLGKIFQILGPGEDVLLPGSGVEDRNRPYKLHQSNHYVSMNRHA